jgi:hypothetical protein
MRDGEPGQLEGAPSGSQRVETALSRLAELDSVGFERSVEIYEDIQLSLSAALDGDEEPAPTPQQVT